MIKYLFLVIATAFSALAENAYQLVNDENGYSYIQINADVDSFKFQSDFKSIGNSGKVGFFVYPNNLTGDALKQYIDSLPADSAAYSKSKDNGTIELGAKNAGDRIGFYLDRNNGDIVKVWSFETYNGKTYIAFDKNGKGKDEFMSIENIYIDMANSPVISGAPLPGFLTIIFIGLTGILFMSKPKFLFKHS